MLPDNINKQLRDFHFGKEAPITDNFCEEFYARVAVVVASHKFLLTEVDALKTLAHQRFGMPPNIGTVELLQDIGVLENIADEQLSKEN